MATQVSLGRVDWAWSGDVSKDIVLKAEDYACSLQCVGGSSTRLRQDIGIALSQCEDLLERLDRVIQTTPVPRAAPTSPADAEVQMACLFDQALKEKDLFGPSDQQETQIWAMSEQVFHSLSKMDGKYTGVLYGLLDTTAALMKRINKVLPKARLHSVDLANIAANSMTQAAAISSTPTCEDDLLDLEEKAQIAINAAQELIKAIEEKTNAADAEGIERLTHERMGLLKEALTAHACKFDVMNDYRNTMCEKSRAEIAAVAQAAFHERDNLITVNAMAKGRVDADLKALHAAMMEINKKHLASEREHTAWMQGCDDRLYELRQLSDNAWDIIAEQEAQLKQHAEERLALVKERVNRAEQETRRMAQKRAIDDMYAARRSVLQMNSTARALSEECYNMSGQIAMDVQHQLHKLFERVQQDLSNEQDEIAKKYDKIYRQYFSMQSDMLFRKKTAAAMLAAKNTGHQYDTRIAQLEEQHKEVEGEARAGLKEYKELIEERMRRVAADTFVHPKDEASVAIEAKRQKLNDLKEEDLNSG